MVPDERCWNWSPLTYNMDRSPTSFATPRSQWYAFLGEHILRADRHATQPKRELLLLHWTESVFHCHVNSYLLAIGRNHWKQLIKAKLAAIEFWKHFAGWSHEPERTGICWVFKKHLLQKFTRIFCIIFSFFNWSSEYERMNRRVKVKAQNVTWLSKIWFIWFLSPRLKSLFSCLGNKITNMGLQCYSNITGKWRPLDVSRALPQNWWCDLWFICTANCQLKYITKIIPYIWNIYRQKSHIAQMKWPSEANSWSVILYT